MRKSSGFSWRLPPVIVNDFTPNQRRTKPPVPHGAKEKAPRPESRGSSHDAGRNYFAVLDGCEPLLVASVSGAFELMLLG
ncbi:MAG: hypothetical protein NTU64_00765, partial [Hyphomicrobiales bacterium]|nr:hypothetical protein [Hyphomicrobiales bacterium]